LLGTSAGYLAAVQAGSIFLFSLIGGVWADHRDHRRVMIASDFIRGLAVLSLPIIAYFMPLTLWTLIPVAITVSSLSAFFNPALNALTPQLTQDRPLLTK
jgi:MFS transporter, DHA3 family, macrolide efflux protein